MRLKIDKSLCVGCRACEIVCAAKHYDEFNPKRSRIKVNFTHPLPSAPKFCIQCPEPKCVDACPTGALYRDEERKFVAFDEDKCILCLNCIKVCPFDGIYYDDINEEILKCDMCDGDPQCVKFCQRKAIYFIR